MFLFGYDINFLFNYLQKPKIDVECTQRTLIRQQRHKLNLPLFAKINSFRLFTQNKGASLILQSVSFLFCYGLNLIFAFSTFQFISLSLPLPPSILPCNPSLPLGVLLITGSLCCFHNGAFCCPGKSAHNDKEGNAWRGLTVRVTLSKTHHNIVCTKLLGDGIRKCVQVSIPLSI